MEFSIGDIVRLRKGVDEIRLAQEGVHTRIIGTTLAVARRGKDRTTGRRYSVSNGNGSSWWLPGSFLVRGNGCMFNKEM